MARNPSVKKGGAKASEGREVPEQEFGELNRDGTINMDLKQLEALREKLGDAAWSKIRFVARNAPFKRGSQILPGLDVLGL